MAPGSMMSPAKSAAMTTLRLKASSYLRSAGMSVCSSVTGAAAGSGTGGRLVHPLQPVGRVPGLDLGTEETPHQETLAQGGEEPAVLPVPGPRLSGSAVE